MAKGTAPDLSAWRPDQARNSFAGTTAESIVLEVSHAHPRLRPGARTGVWCATRLATDACGWRQVNRAGDPMTWPIFWPGDTDFSDPANTRHPSEDLDAAGQYLGDQVAAVVAANGASADPRGYGQAVARELFPDVLSYVIGTPASYGFAGFQRPDAGRQRTRGHALPCHRHGRALRADAGHRRVPSGQPLPVRHAGLTWPRPPDLAARPAGPPEYPAGPAG